MNQQAIAELRQHHVCRSPLDILTYLPFGVCVRVLHPRQPMPVERFTGACDLVSAGVEQGRAEALMQLTS